MSSIKMLNVKIQNNTILSIKTAVTDDVESVLAIGKHLMVDGEGQVIEADEFTFTEKSENKWIESHLNNPSHIILLAEIENITVGILNFSTMPRRRISHTGEFGMGIHKDYRSMGIGKIIFREFIKWAKDNPLVEKVNLRVFENNHRAIKMYKSFGFREDGRKTKEIKLPDGTYLDDISMELLF